MTERLSEIARAWWLAHALLIACLLPGFLLAAGPAVASGRTAVLTVNDSTEVTATVGDPLHYCLRLRLQKGDRIVDRTSIAQGLSIFDEIREERAATEAQVGSGDAEQVYRHQIASFSTGSFDIPPAVVRIVAVSGDTVAVRSNGARVVVRSVLPTGGEKGDIRDIKPPAEIRSPFPWKTLLFLLFLLSILSCLAWLYLRRRRRARGVVPERPPAPIDEADEYERQAQEALDMLARGDHKGYYTVLSEAVRRCVERRFGVLAMDLTTHELELVLGRSAKASAGVISAVADFLSDCDLVKFAKHIPPVAVMRGAVDQGRGIVRLIVIETAPKRDLSVVTGGDYRRGTPAESGPSAVPPSAPAALTPPGA